ncbi:hypothetical protein M3231_05170 [Neobacillus mesonae]|nr:hypothetical protein [Neobacillus mesonae]
MSIHTSLANSKAVMFGMGFGILFMAFFGALWAVTGIIGLQGWDTLMY